MTFIFTSSLKDTSRSPTGSKVLNNFLKGPKIHLLPAYKRGKIYSFESYKTPNVIHQLLLWRQRQQKDTRVLVLNQARAPTSRDGGGRVCVCGVG